VLSLGLEERTLISKDFGERNAETGRPRPRVPRLAEVVPRPKTCFKLYDIRKDLLELNSSNSLRTTTKDLSAMSLALDKTLAAVLNMPQACLAIQPSQERVFNQ